MANLFDSLLGKKEVDPYAPTLEEKIEAGMKPDMQMLNEEPISQNVVEYKEKMNEPSRLTGSRYHALLTKEIGLANLQSDEDEDYFNLAMQVIMLTESMGLTDLCQQFHAQFLAELSTTTSRKGKKLDLSYTEGHRIEKTVGERRGPDFK